MIKGKPISPIELQQTLSPAMFILNKTGGVCDFHKLFKILYFADKEHLVKYGRTITNDTYIAMANGPVPSLIYDYIKVLSGRTTLPVSQEFIDGLASLIQFQPPYYIKSVKEADTDFISASGIECLILSIEKYSKKTFDELTQLSHDSAWNAANDNSYMSVIDIAKDAGANDTMLQYIELLQKNSSNIIA